MPFRLETHLRLDAGVASAPNITHRFSDNDLTALGEEIWCGYTADKASRERWEKRTQSALDLAMQLQKEKSFPWQGASNVAFPLVTIAALQFHARAYPATVPGPDIVRYRVPGQDPDGSAQAAADRIGRHMSYQVLEEDQAWEEQHDRLLITIPIIGCDFKKSYYSVDHSTPVAERVSAHDLVMNYYAKSVDEARRKTHILRMDRNTLWERCAAGTFRDIREETWFAQPAPGPASVSSDRSDARTGLTPPPEDDTTPFTLLEQHCWIDFDQDGYQEPYIITIHEGSHQVLRIVARWNRPEDVERDLRGRVMKIRATEHFTKFGFIPSPDGSIYDIGFGVLLGPLNESVSSLINQLIDAGSMSVAAGGFIAKGVKTRGGDLKFSPFGWQRVDSTGDDLRKGIFPLPVREPSMVLFQLLSLLINYTQRISGSTDFLAGENPGQNTPAETTRTMVEQGMKIYNSLFKRVWRSMKDEFKKRYVLNSIYMPPSIKFGPQAYRALRQDYSLNPDRVCPVADPNVSSDTQRYQQAMMLKQSAATTPGYNIAEVEKRFLQALRIEGMETLYPGPQATPAPEDPKLTIEKMRHQREMARLEFEKRSWALELLEEHQLNLAQIVKLKAEAAKIAAEVQGASMDRQIALVDTAIAAMEARNATLAKKAELLLKEREVDTPELASSGEGGVRRVDSPPGDARVSEVLEGTTPGADGGLGEGAVPEELRA